MKQTGSQFVLTRGFDVLFSVLNLFNKELPGELKESAFAILWDGLDDIVRNIDVFVCSTELSNNSAKLCLANRMKMIVYLLCQLVELIEDDSVQKETANLAKANKSRKKKVECESWDWDGKKLEALTLLFRLLNLNINALFDPPIAEEELVNLIGNCVFRILENPSISLQRCKDVRAGIAQVLGILVSKYGYSLSCRLKIVQSLKLFEHLAVSALKQTSNESMITVAFPTLFSLQWQKLWKSLLWISNVAALLWILCEKLRGLTQKS